MRSVYYQLTWLIGFLFLLPACTVERALVRIGTQPVVGQEIVAQVLKQLIEDQTQLRPTIITCADTYDCWQDLTEQRIDLAVSAVGSQLLENPTASAITTDALHRLTTRLGLTWFEPLGYESGYVLVMPTDRSAALGIASIADLATLPDGVRLAAPAAYLSQVGSGRLHNLLRRYGLRLNGEVQIITEPDKRLAALTAGQVDVSVMRGDNGLIRNVPLTMLADTLRFFPPAQAAVVSRASFLADYPQLEQTLAQLHGQLSQEDMYQLSSEVQLEGRTPQLVAQRFLRQAHLVSEEYQVVSRQPEFVVAFDPREHYEGLETVAVQTVHAVFPTQPVRQERTDMPIEEVLQSRARLALLDAGHFFLPDETNPFGRQEKRIEVVGVVSQRFLHIIRRQDETEAISALSGQIGLPPDGSQSARVIAALLKRFGIQPSVFAAVTELLDQVVAGQLDAALFFETPGASQLAQQLVNSRLVPRSLPLLPAELPAFIRPVRIPHNTYAGQREAVDTLGVQVVLAGPAPQAGDTLQSGGLAGFVPAQSLPFTFAQAEQLRQALPLAEPPEPILPSIWKRRLEEAAQGGDALTGQAILDTGLSLFVIVFLVWSVLLVMRY